MLTETDITRRLHEAADRIDVDVSFDAILDGRALTPIEPRVRRGRSPRGVALLAVSAVVIAGLLVTVVLASGAGRPQHRAPAWQPPRRLPADAPAPGALLPSVAQPPPELGALVAAARDGGLRTGSWVSLVIARPADAGYEAPIVVSVFDGRSTALDGATPTLIGAQSFLVRSFGDVNVVARPGDPTTTATGAVSPQLLADVLAVTDTQRVGDTHTLRIANMPAGYTTIVEPTLLATDVVDRRTLASVDGTLGVAEVSDQVDPLIAAAGSGADLREVDVDGHVAWLGISHAHDPPVTFLIWSPQPGVVFEIDSSGDAHPEADLIALAERTIAVPAEEWEHTYAE